MPQKEPSKEPIGPRRSGSSELHSIPIETEPLSSGTVIGGRYISDALRVQRYRLTIEGGAALGQSYDLIEPETRVGKSADNQIAIENPTVSRTR